MKVNMNVLVTSLSLLLCTTAAMAVTSPTISIDEPSRDFGVVRQGTVLDLVYTVTNAGDEPLELQVRPTCGCTVAEFDKTIAPRSSGTIEVSVDTTKFSGAITKAVLVLSNDPAMPSQRIEVKAEVRAAIEILPRPIVRLEAQVGEQASTTVIVASADDDIADFSITSVEVDSPWVTAEVEPVAKGERMLDRGPSQYRLTLTLSDESPTGLVRAPVKIHTDAEEARSLDMQVVGVVRGERAVQTQG